MLNLKVSKLYVWRKNLIFISLQLTKSIIHILVFIIQVKLLSALKQYCEDQSVFLFKQLRELSCIDCSALNLQVFMKGEGEFDKMFVLKNNKYVSTYFLIVLQRYLNIANNCSRIYVKLKYKSSGITFNDLRCVEMTENRFR